MKTKPRKFYALNAKRHGIGGMTPHPISERCKEERRAKASDFYAVIFFPQYKGVKKTIGGARVNFWGIESTLANSPAAAIVKFMDRIAKGEKWETYSKAGHRVRKVRISDFGKA